VTAERPGKHDSVNISQIYSVGADGSRLQLLTAPAAISSAPAWSPDGKKIAYLSYRAGAGMTLWLMNADGTAKRRLSKQPVTNGQVLGNVVDYAQHVPKWSPDGKWIAFTRDSPRVRGRTTIRVVRADGTSERPVTRASDVRGRWAAGDGQPSWSPDGMSISFVRGGEVWIARADGTEAHVVTQGGWAGTPVPVAWSPSGRLLGFINRGAELWIVRPDGTGKHLIAKWPTWEFAWSPDGRDIAYPGCRSTTPEDCGHITIVGIGGSRRELTKEGGNALPAWSPDGGAIAYWHSGVDEHGSLHVVKRGSAASVDVAEMDGSVGTLAWQPSSP
jgi:TolB protein